LQTYTFKLRPGVTFHNGTDVDAGAVKWNFERIMDPEIGHAFSRSSLANIDTITVVDKHTLRCTLKQPSALFLANVTYYPCNLIAPNSGFQADVLPMGCGPFKIKSWQNWRRTELVRFENYFETDAAGHALPYLDGLVGLPHKQDRARLMALQNGDADLIDHLGYADAGQFQRQSADKFQTWNVLQVGTAWVGFNLKTGRFSHQNPDALDAFRLTKSQAWLNAPVPVDWQSRSTNTATATYPSGRESFWSWICCSMSSGVVQFFW
jgi:peptide/nickel transport system substrate-binding protein